MQLHVSLIDYVIVHELAVNLGTPLPSGAPSRALSLTRPAPNSPHRHRHHHLPPSAGRSEIRILLVFDPWRSVILLVAGDKAGQWTKWYKTAIPQVK